MGLVTRGNPGVSAIDTRPPRRRSWLHWCFAEFFTQIALAGNRGDAERRQRPGGGPFTPTWARIMDLGPFPALQRTRCWGSHPDGHMRDPLSRCHPCHRVQPGSAAAGATRWHQPHVPTAIPDLLAKKIHLSLPAGDRTACQECVRAPCPAALPLQPPQIPGERSEGADLPSRSAQSTYRGFVGVWAMPGSLQSTPGTRGGSIWLRVWRHARVSAPAAVHRQFLGSERAGKALRVTAQHGWVAAANTGPGSGPGPMPVNHSSSWNEFTAGQPGLAAALKTPWAGRGHGTPSLPPWGHSPGIHPTHGATRVPCPHQWPRIFVPTRVPSWPVLCQEPCGAMDVLGKTNQARLAN